MKTKVTRRKFLAGSAGTIAGLSLAGTLPKRSFAHEEGEVIKIGFLGALTGDLAGWVLPGLYGVEIWVEQTNAAGGVKVGGDWHQIEVISYDDEYLGAKAVTGAKKLVLEDEVKFLVMSFTTPVFAAQPFLTAQKMVSTTLTPSDMSPERPYLIAPVEQHPFYLVTGVEWIRRNRPDIKTVAFVTQNDELGMNSLATYAAAFEVAGIEIIEEKLFGFEITDFAPVVSAVLAAKPDMLCLDTAYPDYINLILEQAFLQGWQGPLIGASLDNYPAIIAKTSQEFLEGYIFHYPDFDDPRLQEPDINFTNAAEFYRVYNERHPGAWNAVSWEYAAILAMWKGAVEAADSAEPMDVFKAMKSTDAPHIFGPAAWWGTEVYGIDNAPVGKWPVVQMQSGKPVIVDMADMRPWLAEHQDVLIRHMKDRNVI